MGDDEATKLLDGEPGPLILSQVSPQADEFFLALLGLRDHHWLEDCSILGGGQVTAG